MAGSASGTSTTRWRSFTASRLFYSDVVADYEDLVRSKDLVLGYRLHGNLMALANGRPVDLLHL